MSTRVTGLLGAKFVVSLVLLSLVGASLVGVTPVRAQAATPLPECPGVVSPEELSHGQQAIGHTVRKGTTVETFDVEILDVIPDGIAPGRDLIVIDTSGELIDQAGGIWYGMSGSPIYTLDGNLIGALAYGFSFGPSSIAGVTPAPDMLEVFGYPDSSDPGGTSSFSAPTTVQLSPSTRTAIATEQQTTTSEVDDEMSWLKVPVSISGLRGAHRTRLRRAAIRKDLPFFVPRFTGGSASSTILPTGTLAAGDSFAAALSYGDVTFAGIGTTTYVCDGKALAFGHPFFWSGSTVLGASAATTSAIVDDPVFSAYKLARVTDAVGVVDEDRLAAIRGVLGRSIPTMSVTQDTLALDTSKRRDDATTDVVQGGSGFAAEYLPFIAWIHSFTNIDSVFDQIGPGSSRISWRIQGIKTESGEPWALTRSNRWISDYDISWGSTFELLDILYLLQFQGLEKVKFTDLDISVSVERPIRKWKIQRVLWARNAGRFRDVTSMRVRRGDTITARTVMKANDTGRIRRAYFTFAVPRRGRDGFITVNGGGSEYSGYDYYCFLDEECEDEQSSTATTFDALLAKLQSSLRNDDLVARMSFGRARRRAVQRQNRVVRGRDQLYISIDGGSSPEGETEGEPSL